MKGLPAQKTDSPPGTRTRHPHHEKRVTTKLPHRKQNMSIEAIAAVLKHSKAKGTAKLVLLGIAWHYGENAELGAYPSQATLAAYANTTDRQVRRALQDLIALDEVEYRAHDGRGYRADRRTARYFILLDCPDSCDRSLNHLEIEDIQGRTTGHLRSIDRTFKVERPDTHVRLKVINN